MNKFRVGDIVRTRKGHPCGDDRWEVLRVGMDFRIRCLSCGRVLMLPRPKFENDVKVVLAEAGTPEAQAQLTAPPPVVPGKKQPPPPAVSGRRQPPPAKKPSSSAGRPRPASAKPAGRPKSPTAKPAALTPTPKGRSGPGPGRPRPGKPGPGREN